jgi:hypothetical protein
VEAIMNVGLLWFDDDPRKPLARKIGEAAERYWQRFAVAPTACHIYRPPDEAPKATTASQAARERIDLCLLSSAGEPPRLLTLALVPSGAIRPNYFWVGVDDSPGA